MTFAQWQATRVFHPGSGEDFDFDDVEGPLLVYAGHLYIRIAICENGICYATEYSNDSKCSVDLEHVEKWLYEMEVTYGSLAS